MNIEVAAAVPGSGRETEVRTLERTGTKLIYGWGCQPVSRWNEEHWGVDSSRIRARKHEVRGAICRDFLIFRDWRHTERNGLLSAPQMGESQCDRLYRAG